MLSTESLGLGSAYIDFNKAVDIFFEKTNINEFLVDVLAIPVNFKLNADNKVIMEEWKRIQSYNLLDVLRRSGYIMKWTEDVYDLYIRDYNSNTFVWMFEKGYLTSEDFFFPQLLPMTRMPDNSLADFMELNKKSGFVDCSRLIETELSRRKSDKSDSA